MIGWTEITRRFVVLAIVATVIANFPDIAASAEGGAGKTVKVPRSVDIYDRPGGEGQPVGGPLEAGSEVILLVKTADYWCQVEGSAVPGGKGWVWCGIGEDGQSYELLAIDAGTDIDHARPVPPGGAPAPTGGPPPPTGRVPVPTEDAQAPTGDPPPAGGAPAGQPVKYDCRDLGPNQGAAATSPDPKVKFECETLANGNKRCCWVKYP